MKHQKLVAAILCAVTSSAHATTEDSSLETVIVTGSRFEQTYADKPLNVSIITRETINKSSALTIPELLSQQAGISARDLFGNNAALATVDLRGFGAAAGQNTLILLDGRRITNADLSGVQWSAIPLASIERIEIMRGSGAVLYGDGATSGVINIITKSPTQVDKTGQIIVKAGSYGMTEVQANANYFSGKAGIDFTANQLVSDGYRANNRNEQTNVQANTRWMLGAGNLAFKVGIDRQDIRLPGARLVQPSAGIDQVTTDPRGSFSTWTVLDPSVYTAANGATLTEQGDNSLLVSLAPPTGETTYTITATTALTGITGIRLDAIADTSLPYFGPGTCPINGNFVLEEIQADILPVPEPGLGLLTLLGLGGLVVCQRVRRK